MPSFNDYLNLDPILKELIELQNVRYQPYEEIFPLDFNKIERDSPKWTKLLNLYGNLKYDYEQAQKNSLEIPSSMLDLLNKILILLSIPGYIFPSTLPTIVTVSRAESKERETKLSESRKRSSSPAPTEATPAKKSLKTSMKAVVECLKDFRIDEGLVELTEAISNQHDPSNAAEFLKPLIEYLLVEAQVLPDESYKNLFAGIVGILSTNKKCGVVMRTLVTSVGRADLGSTSTSLNTALSLATSNSSSSTAPSLVSSSSSSTASTLASSSTANTLNHYFIASLGKDNFTNLINFKMGVIHQAITSAEMTATAMKETIIEEILDDTATRMLERTIAEDTRLYYLLALGHNYVNEEKQTKKLLPKLTMEEAETVKTLKVPSEIMDLIIATTAPSKSTAAVERVSAYSEETVLAGGSFSSSSSSAPLATAIMPSVATLQQQIKEAKDSQEQTRLREQLTQVLVHKLHDVPYRPAYMHALYAKTLGHLERHKEAQLAWLKAIMCDANNPQYYFELIMSFLCTADCNSALLICEEGGMAFLDAPLNAFYKFLECMVLQAKEAGAVKKDQIEAAQAANSDYLECLTDLKKMESYCNNSNLQKLTAAMETAANTLTPVIITHKNEIAKMSEELSNTLDILYSCRNAAAFIGSTGDFIVEGEIAKLFSNTETIKAAWAQALITPDVVIKLKELVQSLKRCDLPLIKNEAASLEQLLSAEQRNSSHPLARLSSGGDHAEGKGERKGGGEGEDDSDTKDSKKDWIPTSLDNLSSDQLEQIGEGLLTSGSAKLGEFIQLLFNSENEQHHVYGARLLDLQSTLTQPHTAPLPAPPSLSLSSSSATALPTSSSSRTASSSSSILSLLSPPILSGSSATAAAATSSSSSLSIGPSTTTLPLCSNPASLSAALLSSVAGSGASSSTSSSASTPCANDPLRTAPTSPPPAP
ncbi:hypothetical protein BH10PSE19_BH10PSE19_09880 [soil metagenome]